MLRLTQLAIQTTVALLTLSATADLAACTGVRVTANDNAVVSGRTLEFAQDLFSKIIYIPKGVDYIGKGESGSDDGKKWTVNYPMVGTSGYDLPYIIDGINSNGLAVGIFYFPNYAQYQKATKEDHGNTIAPWELPTYLLSQCATLDEVKKALESIKVIPLGLEKNDPPLELHYVVHDAEGKSMVIEYVGGKLVTYDNPLGVITNAPTFDWHITNLSNYVNLSVNTVPPVDVSGVIFQGPGQGTGLHGMPGDFTPPSRFIRATVFSQSYVPAETGPKAVFDIFHILNQFDIPKGAVRDKNAVEYTQWTSVANLKEKRYYYHTYTHRDVGMVDLMKMDPNAKKVQFFPMDKSVNPPVGQF